MKIENTREQLLKDFEESPSDALFKADTVCLIIGCSKSTLDNNRMLKKGIPFIRMSRGVRYKKSDILEWIENSRIFV